MSDYQNLPSNGRMYYCQLLYITAPYVPALYLVWLRPYAASVGELNAERCIGGMLELSVLIIVFYHQEPHQIKEQTNRGN